jgi:mannose-6-phosphate isomerase-like protein (cupin superfamily)
MFWLFWSNLDESRDLTPYRKPAAILDDKEVIQQSDDGEVRLLLSPNVAATPSLHVSLVSLQPDCEIPSQKAIGVEFYYVVSGTGSFSQQGVVETTPLRKGDCFVVDVGNMRWISSKGAKDELLLLRATDGGNQYNSPSVDRIRHDPNHKVTSIGKITNRIRQVQWQ